MNPLGHRIAALIEAQGPISIAELMTVAMHDPQYGYYATRDPLGADFITAPEISQMFGELLALWIVQCWIDQGKPAPARLVELGPGRGTLMADVLRVLGTVPDILPAFEIILVENSPVLKAAQRAKLRDVPANVQWRDSFDDSLADRSLFLLANEFFDALPIRQYVKTERGWCERMVTLGATGALTFALSPVAVPMEAPPGRGMADIGAIYEVSPASTAFVEEIGRTIASNGGAALLVDYGYDESGGFGETLQALSEHRYKELLSAPGEADLSAHVDFSALARAAEAGGAAAYGPQGQGMLLRTLGIEPRAAKLASFHSTQAKDIADAMDRLINPDRMSTLFQTLAIVPRTAPIPAGFALPGTTAQKGTP